MNHEMKTVAILLEVEDIPGLYREIADLDTEPIASRTLLESVRNARQALEMCESLLMLRLQLEGWSTDTRGPDALDQWSA